MMKSLMLFFFLFFISSSVEARHPIHLSIVNLQYIKDSNRIEYSVQLFHEDFQHYLNHKYNMHLDFSHSSRMTTKEQNAVIDYLTKTFILTDAVNHETLKSVFKQWTIKSESVWLTFWAEVPQGFTGDILIENTIFLELFSDQKNLVIIGSVDEQKGIEFDQRETMDRFIL